MNTLFDVSGLLVMPFWVLMIFAPGSKITDRSIRSLWIAAPPALLYIALVVPDAAQLIPLLLRPELGQITAVLGTEAGTTIAWLHFLAFDLFVGRWIYLDARERAMTPWLSSPLLALTLLLGPSGWLAYMAVRRYY